MRKPKYKIVEGKLYHDNYDVYIYLDDTIIFRGDFIGRIPAADKKLFSAFKEAVKALNEQEEG